MPSPLVLFALALLGLAAISSGAPLPSRFPPSWGDPPAATTFDLVPLPGGEFEPHHACLCVPLSQNAAHAFRT